MLPPSVVVKTSCSMRIGGHGDALLPARHPDVTESLRSGGRARRAGLGLGPASPAIVRDVNARGGGEDHQVALGGSQ